MVDRYGEAIEYDLHSHFGLDLLDFFRGKHSWRKLSLLLARLPVSSHYVEAQLNDPDVAPLVLAARDDAGPARPALRDYTLEVSLLAQMVDLQQNVISHLQALAGSKPSKPVPLLRPVTEVDRLKAAKETKRHLDLVDEVKAAQERWAASQDPDAPSA